MINPTPPQKLILDFFQKNPGQRFYLRELSRKLKADPGNLSRVLKVLAERGLLEKIEEGNLAFFSLKSSPTGENPPPILPDEAHLKAYLRGMEPELVKFCQNLIRTPSVSGVDPEERIAELIFNKASQLGLFPRIIAKDRRRPNLVIDLDEKKNTSRPHFLLVGHMDTIGIGEIDNWRYYPFSGHISGGLLYGRGAIDMKSGIACELFTLKAIKDLKLNLPVSPRILLVSNEEGGSTATSIFDQGMDYLVQEGFVQGTAAIYGYGGSYNVGIGHRGVLRLKVTTKGESIHTGTLKWQEKERGANAVTAMAEILLSLENLELPKAEHPSFPKHGNVITPGTMILHGGTAVSTVPDLCESVVDIRYLPGVKIGEIEEKIKAIAERIAQRRGIRVDLKSFVNIPAVSLSPSEKIVEIVSQASEQVYGHRVSTRGSGPANESFMLIRKGIPTVVFGPLGNGAHADNECVNLSSLPKTIEVYLRTMAQAI